MTNEEVLGWLPPRAGCIVAVCSHQGQVIVAAEYAIYRMREDFYTARQVLEQIHFPKPMPDPI